MERYLQVLQSGDIYLVPLRNTIEEVIILKTQNDRYFEINDEMFCKICPRYLRQGKDHGN
jgi:hypothetical protein